MEASGAIRSVGEKLAASGSVKSHWQAGDVTAKIPALGPADLVTLAYVLDELPPATIGTVTEKLWGLTKGMLVVIEPGTPAGWQRILTVRDRLRSLGAHLVAPCMHSDDCPIVAPDWCHFSRRVARSRVHRMAKGAEVPWEDEKYVFIAASRAPVTISGDRVLSPPRVNGGVGRVKLCRTDGTAAELTLSKRDGDAFKDIRRADWGDRLELGIRDDHAADIRACLPLRDDRARHVTREYPNHILHGLEGPEDAKTPSELHPVFTAATTGIPACMATGCWRGCCGSIPKSRGAGDP